MREHFRRFSGAVSRVTGSAAAFVVAVSLIIVWLVTGPLFNFSDTWQLFINTATTIVTFLMVFLIQNTQNRDTRAIHLKLDELIRSSKQARDYFLDSEELSDQELDTLHNEFKDLQVKYQKVAVERKRKKKGS